MGKAVQQLARTFESVGKDVHAAAVAFSPIQVLQVMKPDVQELCANIACHNFVGASPRPQQYIIYIYIQIIKYIHHFKI